MPIGPRLGGEWMDPRPTNDLIAQLEGRLSPDGRKALEDINALELKFATTEGAQGPSVEQLSAFSTRCPIGTANSSRRSFN